MTLAGNCRAQVFIAILDSIVNIVANYYLTTMEDSFISSEGRIGRFAYILRLVLLLALVFCATYAAVEYFKDWHDGHYSALGPFVGIIVGLICGLSLMMQLIKRLHDMGKPVYLSILLLIPGVNVLLLLYAAVAPSKD